MTNIGTWRTMDESDLDAVVTISDAVHGTYTEDKGVYAERLALYPEGCFVFERYGRIAGYLISHPWHAGEAPAFNAPLGSLPDAASCYYLHDLALTPDARGTGAGRRGLALIAELARAKGFRELWLTAVNGADSYWSSRGFEPVEAQDSAGYGADSLRMRMALPTPE